MNITHRLQHTDAISGMQLRNIAYYQTITSWCHVTFRRWSHGDTNNPLLRVCKHQPSSGVAFECALIGGWAAEVSNAWS